MGWENWMKEQEMDEDIGPVVELVLLCCSNVVVKFKSLY